MNIHEQTVYRNLNRQLQHHIFLFRLNATATFGHFTHKYSSTIMNLTSM